METQKKFIVIGCLSLKEFIIVIFIYFLTLQTYGGDLQVGSASVKITPPTGIPMAGYYYERASEKIHDDLYAKTLVIEKDGIKIALVSCDLIEVSADIVAKVRNIAEKSTMISADHIMIGATHSHTGPVIPYSGNIDNPKGESAEILARYISGLPNLIASSIILANKSLKQGKISFGLGYEETISFNRRFFMTDGTVGWNPGKMNPKIIRPAGPIDPDVSVMYCETTDGVPVSTYVNFALHLDIVGGLEISADMPFTLSTILGNIKGQEMVTLFAQGCCGNLNHINVKTKEPQKGHAEARRIGTVLAGEVIKTYTRLKASEINYIKARREIVRLPLAEINTGDVPQARKITATAATSNPAPFLELVNAFKIIEVFERNGKPIDAEVQVFALGDQCAIVSLPGEIFTELGLYIKSRSPYPYTMIVELANGSIDYVPDRKAFVEGNYEPVSARCAPGSGEILTEKVLKLLNELRSASL